ncbi:2-oxoglutarate dehydrogenase, E2 component, dihydrolipoamide succinyltransferase [Microbacterium sediminis]|uniref:Dihydrolipoamide acetyltransferase component of pyruvate dehydrogenase complex n=1 Tax=Microbacterium sediminis TaxID=904291 RepID=A0A1B9N959_9MICO|nr:2-oxoglutarate dehydrogenase, E2 component, dihydrolipoamide succinyltransferase [Microbacterium sediminis]OCG73084.1 2-oxoglutarate dehydrogenase, E2 component, dihydrolipoamide succinyltransferase [Microbacterium sediminis]QBR74432.1 2-oxoglutarate dehydrogenase, E2 component, dihydrolipoamide succinyltransferase [Microbacterium sediminis]
MSTSVVLPALGESVTEGTITRWLKQVGDTVQADEALLEVSTDKVDTEIPSPVTGVVEEILFQEDDTVEVGAVLAKIGDGSGATQAPAAPAAAEPAAEAAPAVPVEATTVPAADSPGAEAAPVSAPAGSATDIVLPELGESVTEGTVTRWLKKVGDTVAVDEALLEISTDKVDTEVPSPVAGVITEILAAEDETVEVGAVLARVGSGDAAPAAAPAPAAEAPAAAPAPAEAPAPQAAPAPAAPAPAAPAPQAAPAAPAPAAPAAPAAPKLTLPSDDEKVYVTPLVRRLAAQQGVDLATVKGTGVGGRIRKEDVLKAAEAATSAPAAAAAAPAAPKLEVSPLRGTTQPMSRLRKVLASRAVESMTSTAQLTTVVEVDVTKLAAFRDQVKGDFQAKTGDKLSFLPFFALAAAEALKAYPIVNATLDGENIVYPASENLSIAVDTERGLLTPVVRDAGEKNLAQIAHEIADLADRTRNNKLKPDELAGGTFTLTNTGSRGALFDTPVVFLPQSAILGTGVVFKRPGVVKTDGAEAIAIRSYVYLALSYDHRTIDGADAARFLGAVKARLEAADFAGDLGI